MNHPIFALATAGILAFSVSSHALAGDGTMYSKIGAGWNLTDDQDFTTVSGPVQTELDNGYAVVGAIGYDYGQIRAEAELSYRDNDVDEHKINGAGQPNSHGDTSALAVMANGYYDFDTQTDVTPYVGAGVGIARVSTDGYASGATAIVSDDETVLAYQLMAGVEYPIGEGTSINGEYRYFSTQDIDIAPVLGGATTSSAQYQSHTILVGIRHEFDSFLD